MKEKYIEDQIENESNNLELEVTDADEDSITCVVVESDSVPQHIIDEDLADRARERTKELKQMEMFDDDTWNWSGLR